MHNSLHIRDLLKKTNSDPLRLQRRDPHRGLVVDRDARPGPRDFEMEGEWQVFHDGLTGHAEAAADLEEFLSKMGIEVSDEGFSVILLVTVPELPPRAFRLSLDPAEIRIESSDPAGLWAGVTWLEREMRVRRGPFLPSETITREAAWPVQIHQGPWGGNYSVPDFSPEYLSDDSFRMYAHAGINSMMIYGDMMCYIKSAIYPELDSDDFEANIAMLKDAANRAECYGVGFTWVVVGPKLRANHPVFVSHPNAMGSGRKTYGGNADIHCLCSTDEQTLSFYRETFEKVFREVPQLRGLILIVGGESFYHCKMWGNPDVACPRCGPMETEDVIGTLVGSVAESVRTARPGAFVAAWPYNSGSWEHPDGVELARRLPEGVSFLNQIDREHWYEKDGYDKLIWDYSIDFTGPSDMIQKQAAAAKESGTPLMVRTETTIGLEVFQFPYVPAMQRLADKWNVVRDLEPNGVHQSWLFFGLFGSRAEELGLWAAYAPDIDRDEFLKQMATRDFGPAAADSVLRGWQHMSDAVGHIPCVTLQGYYVGPSFLGPCHPLVPEKGADIPAVFEGVLFYLQEGEETFSRSQTEVRSSLVMADLPETAEAVNIRWEGDGDGWDIIEREYRQASRKAKKAWETLRMAIAEASTDTDLDNLGEEILVVELVYRTFLACANTVEFLTARNDGDRERMTRIARAEMKNAIDARQIYERAPWLDITERTDGYYSPCARMIDEKVAWIRREFDL
jgi:hypothetical protein